MSSVSSPNQVRLRVKDAGGVVRLIEYPDMSQAEAVRRAGSRGMRILAIESAKLAAADGHSFAATRFPLLLFSQELLALLEAGLNLNEALTTLHAKERHAPVRAILGDMLRALSEGRNFSDVLAHSPRHFPEVYVATVRAAERTGDLPQALSRYIAYQLQLDSIRKKLVSAAIYPAMLMIVGGLVTLFLMGYVVPRFSAVYETSGRKMPWASTLLLSFGQAVAQHWQIALVGAAVLFGSLGWVVGRATGRLWLLNQFARLPWLARKADEFRLARFYRAVSLLLAAGISLPRAMGMVNGLLGPEQQRRLGQARVAVEQGQSLSTALIGASLASAVAESLIKVGERSGQLAEMLERTARFADDDFARWVDVASKMLEPMLMTFIGLVIGAVVVLMYMPIFELAGSLQ